MISVTVRMVRARAILKQDKEELDNDTKNERIPDTEFVLNCLQ